MCELTTTFGTWLDTFIDEKGLNPEHVFEIEAKKTGWNYIPLGCVIDAMKNTPRSEQNSIKTQIVRLDFYNQDVMGFFRHLASFMAEHPENFF